MEMSLYFTVFVLTMCAVHLVWTASAHIDSWWNESILRSKKSEIFAASRGGISAQPQAPQRSDWYAFFHCSDLTGGEPLPQEKTVVRQETTRPPATTSPTDTPKRNSRRSEARLSL